MFLNGRKEVQTCHSQQIVLRPQAKRDGVTRCETRPKLVRTSLRNSSFRWHNIFFREALRSLEPRVRSLESGVRSRESRVGSPEPEVPSRDPELIAPLGPTRSVVVEAPLPFLPGRGAKPQCPLTWEARRGDPCTRRGERWRGPAREGTDSPAGHSSTAPPKCLQQTSCHFAPRAPSCFRRTRSWQDRHLGKLEPP